MEFHDTDSFRFCPSSSILNAINPFPQIPETKSRLRESLGARFPETKSGMKNKILILGTSGSAFSGNKIRTQILDNNYNL